MDMVKSCHHRGLGNKIKVTGNHYSKRTAINLASHPVQIVEKKIELRQLAIVRPDWSKTSHLMKIGEQEHMTV